MLPRGLAVAATQDRLQALSGDLYRYEFRRPWRDGTVAIELSGQELIEKLVALIPAPRANLVRYHGTLAPTPGCEP